jgi:hypothetical protein
MRSAAGQARGGFALGRGAIVTWKASICSSLRHALAFPPRSNLLRKSRTVLFRFGYDADQVSYRLMHDASSRDESLRKKCLAAQTWRDDFQHE